MAVMTIGEVFEDLDSRINTHLRKLEDYQHVSRAAVDDELRRGAETMAVVEGNLIKELREIRDNLRGQGALWL